MREREVKGIDVLPHREPFLFLDRQVSSDAAGSVAGELDVEAELTCAERKEVRQ